MSFPDIDYTLQGYSWTVSPDTVRTTYASKNTRQRNVLENRNDIFSVRHILTDAQFLTFENYVTNDLENGSATDTFPYFTNDVEQNGTGRIVNGTYDYSMIKPGLWEIKYNIEIEDRDLSVEEGVYTFVNNFGSFNIGDWLDALEDLVNFNNL